MKLSRVDLALVAMVVIWGANYSVLKVAFQEIPPQPFNALRMVLASIVFAMAITWTFGHAKKGARPPRFLFTHEPLSRRDILALAGLGLVGHFAYQLSFVGGVARTSVANSSLIIGATPVCIAIVSAALGKERVSWMHWLGAAVSAVGIWIVVGMGAGIGGATLTGDLMILASVACWTTYTVGASSLLQRHSPLFVTGTSMAMGAIPYVLVTIPQMAAVNWAGVSAWTWWALIFSSLFALCLAYLIWYAAVQKIGMARTSIYSNLVPISAMSVAALWLGEPLTAQKIAGAALVLGGVALTRLRLPLVSPGPR
ncbi:MAG TPA: DMT family transporter [Vicinamibacterales bacterium]|nr:DMT family transporter [Vicinamibacterales bacterium]